MAIRTFFEVRMASVLIKAYVVRCRRTKVAPRIYESVLGKQGRIFLCSKSVPIEKERKGEIWA